MDFVYAARPAHVIFGAGKARTAPAEMEASGAGKWLIVGSKGTFEREAPLIDSMAPLTIGRFDGIEPHCPIEVAEAAFALFNELGADGVLTIGGGSTIGVGKFIRVRTGKPYIALPTTFSGSELTPIHGAKIGNEKRTGRDPAAMPTTVVYDPELLRTLPASEIAGTGMNSLAHCLEGFYPHVPNPLAGYAAYQGTLAHIEGLPLSIEQPNQLHGKQRALYGAFLGGLVVQFVGIGLHHQLCHILGGHFDLSHGESNSAVLPHVVAYNEAAILAAAPDLTERFGAATLGRGVFTLARRIGAPRDLKSLGVPRDALLALVDTALHHVTHNPRPIERAHLVRMFEAIWAGDEPAPI